MGKYINYSQVPLKSCRPRLAESSEVGGSKSGDVIGLLLEQTDEQPVQSKHWDGSR